MPIEVEDILRECGLMDDQTASEASREQPLSPVPRLNPQLFQSGSPDEQHYRESEDALHNSKMPNLRVLHESPIHRGIIYMRATGASLTEIARATGYTVPWISQLLRQPWAQARLVKELKEAGQDAVQGLIKSAAEESVLKLIEMRDTATRPADVISASNSLLDRFLGKPTQTVKSEVTHRTAKDLEAVDAELAALDAEERRLTGKN